MTHRQRLVLIATIIGSGMVVLDGTVVNLALPAIARNFHASFSDLQWVVDGYMLSLSSLILLGGSLGDILGLKRVYLTGLLGFGITSMLCGLAPNITLLIAMRFLQGIFGALLVPGALAIINTNFPAGMRAAAIGRWAAWLSIGPALGPFIGGYLVDSISWRWVFFINVPLLIICFVLAARSINESRQKTVRKIDYKGAGLVVLGLAALTGALIEGPARHWDGITLGVLALGALALTTFIFVERRQPQPMLNLSLFRSRNFTGANITTFALYGALSGFIFALVIFLQVTMHYSSLHAGVSLLPVTILLFLFSSRVGRLAGRFGPRLFMTVGPIIAGIGMLILLPLSPGHSYVWHVLPGVMLFGIGLTLTVSPLTITVMGAVPEGDSGIASGVNNAISRVAGLIVVAILGILGSQKVFHFTLVFCGILAIAAGFVSFWLIRNNINRKAATTAAH